MKRLALQTLGSLALGLAGIGTAHAGWTFGSAATTSDSAASGITVTTSGFKAANGGTYDTSCNNKTIAGSGYSACGGTDFASGATWAASATTYYSGSGLGMSSDGSTAPNHALDNGPQTSYGNITGLGNTESILLSFSSSVVLSSIGIGWLANDADISLFRYTGVSAPSLSGAGATLAQMQSNGWQLVGNYGDLVVDTSTPYNPVNAGGLASSWWLVTAYNTSYGAATTGSVGQGNDYFKVYAVAGSASPNPGGQTPEPASLALVAAALASVSWARRRASLGPS